MASSTIRKAIGVVKDQTSISIAKVAGNVAPDLEVLIVKATGHDNEPAEEKYIREILTLTSYSRNYVNACVCTISKRLNKTHDWIVALKALMLVHRLLVDGDLMICQELMFASRKGTRVLNMSDFHDDAHSNSWAHVNFVRNYAVYLNQKLEFIAFERKLGGENERRCFEIGNYRDEPYNGVSQRSKSYGDLHELGVKTLVKEMKPERVLERLNQLLCLLECVWPCIPQESAKNSRMVLVALYLVLKESFRIYVDICEALRVLLDLFPEMEYATSVKAFDEYINASKKFDKLADFYKWCKDVGVGRSSEFPEVQKITDKLLGTLQRFIKEKTNTSKSPEKAKNEISPNMNDIKALPPPQNHTPPPPPLENHTPPPPLGNHTPPPPPATTPPPPDLVNLKDDDMSADAHGNKLALDLFSGPPTVNPNSSWEVFSSNGAPEADWEQTLVESASNLLNQKANMGGGLDPLLLKGMYDQGAVSQHVSHNQLTVGSSSSVVMPGLGKTSTPVLALPASDGTVKSVGPQDPFEASLMVPPPSYVQISDMEKKQNLLVHEQQVWQQFGSNGMQGQTALSKIGGMGQQAGYYHAHY